MTEPSGWTRAALAVLKDRHADLSRDEVLEVLNTARRAAKERPWSNDSNAFGKWIKRYCYLSDGAFRPQPEPLRGFVVGTDNGPVEITPTGRRSGAMEAWEKEALGYFSLPLPEGYPPESLLGIINAYRKTADLPAWEETDDAYLDWRFKHFSRVDDGYFSGKVRYVLHEHSYLFFRPVVARPVEITSAGPTTHTIPNVHLLISTSFRDWLIGFLNGAGTLANDTNPTDAELQAAVRDLAKRSPRCD